MFKHTDQCIFHITYQNLSYIYWYITYQNLSFYTEFRIKWLQSEEYIMFCHLSYPLLQSAIFAYTILTDMLLLQNIEKSLT